VYNIDSTVIVIAEHNYWGDPSGPHHPTLNPGGLGDSANVYVDPAPWTTEPFGVRESVHGTNTVERRKLHISPNPISVFAVISFEIPKACHVLLQVFDIAGRLVETIFRGEFEAGRHSVGWETTGHPQGVYLLRLNGQGVSETRAVLVIQ
jgi:hypothetical protein